MMSIDILNSISEKLGGYSYSFVDKRHLVEVDSDKMIELLKILKDDLDTNIVIDYFGIDNSKLDSPSDFSKVVIINLLSMEHQERFFVKVLIKKSGSLPAIRDLWKNVSWYERECTEMFSIKMDNSKHYNLLLEEDDSYYPLLKKFNPAEVKEKNIGTSSVKSRFQKIKTKAHTLFYPELSVGPFYSLFGEGPKISINYMGERIINTCVEVGYFHRGIEKQLENINYDESLSLINKWNSSSSILPTICWVKTIEENLNITIPEKAQAIRMIIMELSRISDHLIKIANVSLASGSSDFYSFSHTLIKNINAIIAELFLDQQETHYIIIGGVSSDIPKYWIANCIESLKKIENKMFYFDKNLIKHKVWIDRLSVGRSDGSDLISRGITGPVLRASGINYDLRKRIPYYFYDEVEFEIPLGNRGDCYDIFLVRREEILQSCSIIFQILDNLPMGDFNHRVEKSPLQSFKDVYGAVEGSDGEIGAYLLSDVGHKPYRVKLRSPSFPLCQYLEELLIDEKVEDIVLILASLGINCSELDR